MDPFERWDDWEWERAAREIGRENRMNSDARNRSAGRGSRPGRGRGPGERYYFSGDRAQYFMDRFSGSQKRVALAALLFLTIIFSSKGEDFFSRAVYSFYQGAMESGDLYAVMNAMAKEAIGISDTGDTAVNAPVQAIFYPPVGGAVKVGYKGLDFSGSLSQGIEIESSLGTPVLCPQEGVVQEVGDDSKLGRMVRINFSNGWEGVIGNLGDVQVKKGDPVVMGTKIGTVGISSPRQKPWLYLELRQNGKAVNPLNYLIQNK